MPWPTPMHMVQSARLAPWSTISVAAVIGHRFDVGLLASVADIPMPGLAQVLDEATRVGVLAEPEGVSGSCRFAHALIAEA